MEYLIPGKEHFRVSHDSWDDGGGTWFGQDYILVLKQRYGRAWQHCLEWCAGPGFIGFGLLAHGLCYRLTLHDKHPPLAQHVAITCDWNHCHDKVDCVIGPTIDCIPYQKFDLVVANPPHYLECPGDDNYQRLTVDSGWQAHRDFFRAIPQYLAQDGIILMQENQAGSIQGVREFWDMIHDNQLEITAYWTSKQFWNSCGPTQIYYIEIQHRR